MVVELILLDNMIFTFIFMSSVLEDKEGWE